MTASTQALRAQIEQLERITHNGDAEMVLNPRRAIPLDECFVRLSDVLATLDRSGGETPREDLSPDEAKYLSDLAYEWAVKVDRGETTWGYALRTVAVLAYEASTLPHGERRAQPKETT